MYILNHILFGLNSRCVHLDLSDNQRQRRKSLNSELRGKPQETTPISLPKINDNSQRTMIV